MRTRAFVSGLTGLLLLSTPVLAQTPPGPPPALPTQVETPEPITIEPGARIRSSDGAVLGQFFGWRTNPAGSRELVVRSVEGEFRAVPVDGISQTGREYRVGWTHHQFMEAPTFMPASVQAPPKD